MAISWLQGDDAAVRAHFTEVERVPKALEVTEYVSLLDHLLVSLQGNPRCWACQARLSGFQEGAGLGGRQGEGSGGLGTAREMERKRGEAELGKHVCRVAVPAAVGAASGAASHRTPWSHEPVTGQESGRAPGIIRSSWWSQAVGRWLAATARLMRAQGPFTHVLSATATPISLSLRDR